MLESKELDLGLSKTDTSILKGFAILGMLLWHLYYAPNPLGITFSPSLRFLSILGNFCVSAFLFASGYGLTVSYLRYMQRKPETTWGGYFVVARLVRFFFNYWFVFLIFVPIGVFVFNQPISKDGRPTYYILLKNFTALSGGDCSYNSAWWFNTLILKYYILFPILFFCIRRKPIMFFFSAVLSISLASVLFLGFRHNYLIVFLVGMIWAYYNKSITLYFKSWGSKGVLFISGVLFMLSSASLYLMCRESENEIYYRGLPFFGIITVSVALAIKCVEQPKGYSVVSYLGKHSGNIYMIHSFLYYYWFPDFFYSMPPLWMFITLLLSSIAISIVIEKMKNIVLWNNLSNIVSQFILNK